MNNNDTVRTRDMDVKLTPKQAMAYEMLTNHNNGVRQILFGGAAGGGKAVADKTKVLTNKGFIRADEVTMDDMLVAKDGEYTKILGIFPQGKSEMYEITFSDGRKVQCDLNHRWLVYSKSHGWRDGWVVRDTKQLLKNPTGWNIPLAENVPGKKWDGPDPYILGYILGDGTLTGARTTIYTVDEPIMDYLRKDGWSINKYDSQNTTMCQISDEKYRNVLGRISKGDKKIPEELFDADYETRLAVLQGLMDSDGYCDKKDGSASFTNKSEHLIDGVCRLTWSLGGKATKHFIDRGEREIKGYKSDGKYWKVQVQYCGKFNPFRLPRKAERAKIQGSYDKLGIKSIKKIKDVPARCFAVEHESHTFVIEDYIVTHNSYLGCTWLIIMSIAYPGTRYFIARNELMEIKKSTLLSFYDVAKTYGLKKNADYWFNASSNIIYFKNGSEIHLIAVAYQQSDPQFQFLGSTEYTAGFIEEAATVHPTAHTILYTRIRYRLEEFGMMPKMLITANPNKGYTYTMFYKPHTEGVLSKTKMYIPSTVFDNPFLSQHYIDSFDELPPHEKERLKNGSWETEQSDDAIIQDYDKILDMFTNELEEDHDNRYYIICDVAHTGKDKTVVTVWKGMTCVEYKSFAKTKTTEVAVLLQTRMRKYSVPASRVWVDATGIGQAIPDLVPGIKKFFTNSAPKKDRESLLDPKRFDNIKTQCAYKLADYIDQRKICIANISDAEKKDLIEDLEQIRKKDAESEGKLGLKPKKEIKKYLGRSPDGGDVLIIRMAATLTPSVGITWIGDDDDDD